MFKKTKLVAAITLAGSFVASQPLFAAGFALNDHSATASGTALAGAAASNQDISFSYWNPALFANAEHMSFYVSGAYISPKMDITVNSATDPNGNSLSGDASSDVVNSALIPAAYFTVPLSPSTMFGVSLNAPFGLSGKYGRNWAGRYHSAESKVEDVSLAFSLAQRLGKWGAIGGGLHFHDADILLASALTDFQGGNSANGDGYGELTANDTAVSYSIGYMVEPIQGTRIGAGYRSSIDFTFEGEANYENVGVIFKNLGLDEVYLFDEITFPSVLSLGFEQDLADKWTLGMTAMRTGWSSMDELRIAFDVGEDGNKQPDSVLTFDFEDQWFYSIGVTYDYSDKLTLRTGLALDNSPIKDQYRSARTPDGDRSWISLGGTYHVTQATDVTFSYTHVNIDDVSVIRDGSLDEDASRGTLDADYKSSADVFSLALNMNF